MPGLISHRAAGIGIPLAAVAIMATACGGGTTAASAASTSASAAPPPPPSQTTAAPTTTAPATTAAPGPTVTVRTAKGGYGVWLTDQTGRTLYIRTSDKGRTSRCYGSCATEWPPLLTTGQVTAADAAVAHDLGTTTRTNGTTQVTYAGHPLYYFDRENGPDQVKGLGAQGIAFLLTPTGTVIKPPPPMAPPRMVPPPMTRPTMVPPPMR